MDITGLISALKVIGSSPSPWLVILLLGGGLIFLLREVIKNTSLVKVLIDRHATLESLTKSVSENQVRLEKHEDILGRLDGTISSLTKAIEALTAEQATEREERTHLQRTIDSILTSLGELQGGRADHQRQILSLQEWLDQLCTVIMEIDPRISIPGREKGGEDDIEARRRLG